MSEIVLSQYETEKIEEYLAKYDRMIELVKEIRERNELPCVDEWGDECYDEDDIMIEDGIEIVNLIEDLVEIACVIVDVNIREPLKQLLFVDGKLYDDYDPNGFLKDSKYSKFSIYDTDDIRAFIENYLKTGVIGTFNYNAI